MNYSMERSLIHLDIGKVIITREKIVIRTILGSCVSVVMFVPSEGLSLISHSIYPGSGKVTNLRYTADAINRMDKEILKNGIKPQSVTVKLFGGGQQFFNNTRKKVETVQSENVLCAINELQQHGYTISARNVGGTGSREIMFYTNSGDVLLKHSPAINQI